jgi:hypothetical protein
MGSKVGNYVEIDLPYCSLTFGESPCTATGVPCFNTRNLSHDCGDTANYSASVHRVRFVEDTGFQYWPDDSVPTFPLLERVDTTSPVVNPGVDMGQRGTCSFSLKNSISSMVGLDKNIIARTDGGQAGTFLGKFKARFPFLYGANVRVYRTASGQAGTLENFIVDNWSGPDSKGGMSFKCVDKLKLTAGKTSQFPAPTDGKLIADIDATATSFTVEPIGIGDIQYPASGKISVGKEGMTFTRVGDVFTVARGLYDYTEPHKIGDRVQVIGEFINKTAAEIIYELLDEYTPVEVTPTNLAQWQQEMNSYLSAVYSAQIASPQPVSQLINELIEQAGLIFFYDLRRNNIVLKVLRPLQVGQLLTEEDIIGFTQRDMQDKRVSQAWTFYNQKDPLKKLDDEFNYYSTVVSPTEENLYPTEIIKKIYSRWIPAGAQSVALELNSRILERYTHPPREFDFNLFASRRLELGESVTVQHFATEDAFGQPAPSPALVTQFDLGDAFNRLRAQEFYFTAYTGPGGGGNIIISIDSDTLGKSLRDLYPYTSFAGVASITYRIKSGTVVGALSNQLPGLTVGDFGSIVPTLIVEPGAYIVGAGGQGSVADAAIRDGGDALVVDAPLVLINNGTIGGGGGAGGSGIASVVNLASEALWGLKPSGGFPGGGSAVGIFNDLLPIARGATGVIPNVPGQKTRGYKLWLDYVPSPDAFNPGTGYHGYIASIGLAITNGPPGPIGPDGLWRGGIYCGDGGDLGQPGYPGFNSSTIPGGPGGLPGRAIVGLSNLTSFTNTGSVLGAQV